MLAIMERFLHPFSLGNDPPLDIAVDDRHPFLYPPLIARQRTGKKPPKRTDYIANLMIFQSPS